MQLHSEQVSDKRLGISARRPAGPIALSTCWVLAAQSGHVTPQDPLDRSHSAIPSCSLRCWWPQHGSSERRPSGPREVPQSERARSRQGRPTFSLLTASFAWWHRGHPGPQTRPSLRDPIPSSPRTPGARRVKKTQMGPAAPMPRLQPQRRDAFWDPRASGSSGRRG